MRKVALVSDAYGLTVASKFPARPRSEGSRPAFCTLARAILAAEWQGAAAASAELCLSTCSKLYTADIATIFLNLTLNEAETHPQLCC